MKILALEVEAEDACPEQFEPHLRVEARGAWELHQRDVIRELYFRWSLSRGSDGCSKNKDGKRSISCRRQFLT